MGKILVATDFTSTSEKAYRLAADVAQKTESEIVLVHVSSQLYIKSAKLLNFLPSERGIESELHLSESELEKHAQKKVFNGINVTKLLITEHKQGFLEIANEIIEKNEISLVVVGTNGVRSTHQSLAANLIKTSSVPVITVGENIETVQINNITVATDFENVNYKYLDSIWNLQKAYNAHLQILFVNTPANFKETDVIEKEYELFVNNYELDNVSLHVYNSHLVEEGILKFSEKNNTDLLAISTHGRTGIVDLLHKSFANYVVGHSKIPVYVYNMFNDKVFYNTVSNVGMGSYYA